MTADQGIPVIVGPEPSAGGKIPMSSGAAQAELKFLDAAKLKSGIDALCRELREVFDSAREVGNYELSEVSIGLEISGEGRIFLIGKAGLKGALELKFSPRKK